MIQDIIARLNRCARLGAVYIRKICSAAWPMPGALLFFGCGKLMLLYSGRAMKWTWTDEYLTDVAVMGSLLGAVRLVLHSLKRLQRVQYIRTHHNTLAVIESKWVVSMAVVVYGLIRWQRCCYDGQLVISNEQILIIDLLMIMTFLFSHHQLLKTVVRKPAPVKDETTLKPMNGLRNLGNTCYFNAAMQNIYATKILATTLTEVIETSENATEAPIARALVNFYKEMSKTEGDDIVDSFFGSAYDPSQLFNALCRRSPRFLGGRQQDSHEALRHLLDGVKEEHQELKRQQRAAATASGLPTDVSRLTVVDSVFGGQYLTMFHCERCQTPYHLFEPFLDMSLPIAFEDEERKTELAAASVATENTAVLNNSKCKEWQAASDDAGVEAAEEKDAYRPAAAAAGEPASEQSEMKNADEEVAVESVETETQTRQDSFSEDGDDDEKPESEAADCEQDVMEKAQCSERDTEYVAAVNKVKERLKETTVKPKDNSVLNCLRFYTREEHLDEYFCLNCNQGLAEPTMQKGTKQTLIFNPPAVLTIHLKRFEQTSRGYAKVTRHIAFEEYLDLAPYCTRFASRQQAEESEESFVYRLYGVVVHIGGSLEHGHYTACVRLRNVPVNNPATAFLQKTFLDREKMMSKEQLIRLVAEDLPRQRLDDEDQWFDISDSSVCRINKDRVFDKEAYLLFYERLS